MSLSPVMAIANPAGLASASSPQWVAAAQNRFGFGLLSTIARQTPGRNILLSPSSVFLASAMLELDAGGETREAIRQALRIPAEFSDTQFHESAASFSGLLQSRSAIELSIANGLWSDRSAPLGRDFAQQCWELYSGHAESLDFRDPAASAIINSWISYRTKAKISEIVTARALDASRTILTNAVYFKGKWQFPFDLLLTADAPFHLGDGSVKRAPFMRRSGLRNAYRSGYGFEAAVLPYAGNHSGKSSLALVALLPAPGCGPDQIPGTFDLHNLLADDNSTSLSLIFPRLRLDYSASLRVALASLGMSVAFEYPRANFERLGSRDFFIGDFFHKTRLEVDEQGAIAAAAAAVSAHVSIGREPQGAAKTLVFNRPFAFLICDLESKAVLFAGLVYEP